jgi:hypothetical protein
MTGVSFSYITGMLSGADFITTLKELAGEPFIQGDIQMSTRHKLLPLFSILVVITMLSSGLSLPSAAAQG